MTDPLNLLKGTVDLLILKALQGGPRHGYAVAEWIGSVTDGTLSMEEGTLYPALHRLERKRLIHAEWGLSDNNRRAKFYRLTDEGLARLADDARDWGRYSAAVNQALAAGRGEP
jgi:transcriptional regulator